MTELVELRVDEEFASMLFSDSEGRPDGVVRVVMIETKDPRFKRVCQIQNRLIKKYNKQFFWGWQLRQISTADELGAAQVLRLVRRPTLQPAGEQCGTRYDESTACSHCGAGARQVGPLMLRFPRLPKSRDFAETIAGEVIISRRASGLFVKHGITGVDFGPVCASSAQKPIPEWRQLIVKSSKAEIVAPTRAGNNPCDDDPKDEYRCPKGHVIGLNLLSAVSISGKSRGKYDFVATKQLTGDRRGLLRPTPAILISQKVWRLITSEKLKGFDVEIAHPV